MEFIKNDLIDECLTRYYETFRITLDTCDFVPDKYNDRIHKYIFKNLKRKFKEIDREYKKQQCNLKLQDSRPCVVEGQSPDTQGDCKGG